MKKAWKYFILVALLGALMCTAAFAADEVDKPTFEKVASGASFKMLDGGEKFEVSYTGATSGQYLILMVEGTKVEGSDELDYTIIDDSIMYVNQAAGTSSGVAFTVYPKEMTNAKIMLGGGTGGPVTLGYLEMPEPEGFTVSGTVTSYLTGDATVELIQNGETVKTATGATYEFKDVAPGTYTLKVSKTNHVTREYEITVEDAAVTQDAKIHPVGDVTGDGAVKMADYLKVLAQSKGVGTLAGYELKCADVTGDGAVKMADYLKVLAHSKGVTLLW